jgi:2-polyprenyl-6-methoxyphenol hydroxylase-like FAD-dependent oxidoreductase
VHDQTEKQAAPLHVLIVGGGIGGLCLAQGLVKSGIGVAVYERDASARFRRQGYRVSLREHGPRALRDCLPADLFDLCVATSIRPATRMAFLDDQLDEKFAKPTGHADTGPDDAAFGVNRLILREILLARLDGVVHFAKFLERYERLAGGRVRAHFATGTSATGDLLVGADGTSSAVRRLLLPAAGVQELDTAIYGMTPLTADTLRWLPGILVGSFTRILGSSGTAMALTTCQAWEPVAAAAARIAPDVRLGDVPDYVSWTLSPVDAASVDPEGAPLHRRARELVAGWHPALRRIVEAADVPATYRFTVGAAVPVAPWPAGNVTLLGDAIHTMTPGRGEGANTALRDAGLLRDALVDVAAGRVPLVDAVARYQAEMLRYGFQAVADSLHRPFGPPRRTG